MKRYQAYLDPQSVVTMDDVARLLDVSRSQIIRSDNPLLKMAGVMKGINSGISENVDEIYLQD